METLIKFILSSFPKRVGCNGNSNETEKSQNSATFTQNIYDQLFVWRQVLQLVWLPMLVTFTNIGLRVFNESEFLNFACVQK